MNKSTKLLKVTILLASMLTMLANAVVAPALPEITKAFPDLQNAELLTKLMMTLPALTIAFLAPFMGIIIDRTGRIRVLVISLIIYALAGSSGFYLNDLYSILAGRVLLGFGVAGTMTAATTLIGDYFVGFERNKFLSLQSTFIALGGLFFITSAGYLAGINWHLPFLIYTFSLVVLILVPFSLYEPAIDKAKKSDEDSSNSNVGEIILAITATFFGVLFFYVVPVQVPYLIASFDGVGSKETGLAIGLMSLSQAISAYFYKNLKNRFSFRQIFAMSFVIMSASFILLAYSNSLISVIVAIVVLGAGVGWIFPNANLWMISIVHERVRGLFVGILNSFAFLGMFASPLFIQPLQENFGMSGAFNISAAVLFGLFVFYVLKVKGKR